VYQSCTRDYRNHPVTAARPAHSQGKPVTAAFWLPAPGAKNPLNNDLRGDDSP
jgi:hypothetical protein